MNYAIEVRMGLPYMLLPVLLLLPGLSDANAHVSLRSIREQTLIWLML